MVQLLPKNINGYAKLSGFELDGWIVMPNHFHGIMVITDKPVGAFRVRPYINKLRTTDNSNNLSKSTDETQIIITFNGAFKSITTKKINILRMHLEQHYGNAIITNTLSVTKMQWIKFVNILLTILCLGK